MRWRGWSWLRRAGWALVVAGAVALAVALPARGLSADEPGFSRIVGWSNILGFSVGAAGFVLLLLDRHKPARDLPREAVDQAADALADRVLERESRERARLLGTDAPSLISANVRFDRSDALVRFQQVGAGRGSDLDGVREFYQEHTDGRLVILGDPGSGKTVLALELLVQLLEQRRDRATDAERVRDAVPVRFSLPAWNTDQPLLDWLTAQLSALFGLPDAMAGTLVRTGRILPVLDGLDEMDPPDRAPTRAPQAVARLNDEYLAVGRQGAPLVLTCRIDDYARVHASVRPAVNVRIQPLTPHQIVDYLRRVSQVREAVGWPAWQEVLSELGHAPDRRLLEQLNTPWRLTLAATFSHDGGDVTDLLPTASERPTADEAPTGEQAERYAARVTSILFDTFVPARTRLYGGDRYTPDQVTGWLRNIAGHLQWQAEHSLSGSDIVLHEWWPIAGRARVKRWHAILGAVMIVIAAAVLGIAINGGLTETTANVRHYFAQFPFLPRGYLIAGITAVLALFVAPYLAISAARSDHIEPTRFELQQLRTYQGRRRLAGGLATGVAGGFAIGFVIWLALPGIGFTSGLVYGLVAGLVYGLVAGLEPLGVVAVDPRDPLRNDLLVWVATGAVVGVAAGLAASLAGALVVGVAGALLAGVAGSLVAGLTFADAGNAWLRYSVAMSLAARDRQLPMRFGTFLHWANGAGILRISGNAYQFRHSELRDRLQEHNQPSDSPSPLGRLIQRH